MPEINLCGKRGERGEKEEREREREMVRDRVNFGGLLTWQACKMAAGMGGRMEDG